MRVLHGLLSWVVALATAPWRWARRRALAFEDQDALTARAPGRRTEVDGVTLHYVERGRGDAIVLIHGLGASTFAWRNNIDELARSFRVVAVDLLGFGYSQQVSDAEYSLAAHARRTAHLMDALGIESAVIVGHSLGGGVAQHLAAEFPAKVRRLALIDSATVWETRAVAFSRFFALFNPFYYAFVYHNARIRRRVLERLYFDPSHVTEDVVEEYLRPARFKGHQAALARLARDLAGERLPDASAIGAPGLVLWGAADRVIRLSRGRWLAKRLHARIIVIPKAGHMSLEEQPQAVDRAIAEFAAADVRRAGVT